jgi:hypothetical protein
MFRTEVNKILSPTRMNMLKRNKPSRLQTLNEQTFNLIEKFI